jgi:hypothetical protein
LDVAFCVHVLVGSTGRVRLNTLSGGLPPVES